MATTRNDGKLLRSMRSVLPDADLVGPAIARAFLEERRLILVSNQRLLEAADLADAGVVAAFRRKLAEHDADLSFDLIQRLLGAQQPSSQRKGNGVVYTPRHVVEAVCARVVKLSREMRKELDRLGENELPGRVHVTNGQGQSTEVQSSELSTLIDRLVNTADLITG